MQTATVNNTVNFLLDGDEFFEQLHIAMRDLYNSAAAANSCLRLAYWGFDRMTTLPACTDTAGTAHAATPIKDLINLLATKGHIVQIIMWYGQPVFASMDSNWEARDAFNLLNEGGAHQPTYRAIDIYMEIYNGKWTGYSTHQKIAIVTIAGVKQAFVGGFNVMADYLSDDVHTLPIIEPFTNRWHDTGVKVGGPICDAIEAEWVRRWRKQDGNGTAPNTAFANTPAIMGANIPIRLLTTNAEDNPIETDIRTAMVERINAAQDLVYLENYALSDPSIVQAMAARQVAPHPPTMIAVVNYPSDDDPFSYLMYYSYINLTLNSFTTLTYGDLPNTLNKAGININMIKIAGLNPNSIATFKPVSSYSYKYSLTGASTMQEIPFGQIKSITAPETVMYAPQNKAVDQSEWTYPHSKLAIFDDRYTVIGTSNWTYRSMQYDGEIALEIDNQAFTTALRNRLFAHWRQPNNPTQWYAQAVQNAVDLAAVGTVPDGEVRITPLRYGNFMNPTKAGWNDWGTSIKHTIAALF